MTYEVRVSMPKEVYESLLEENKALNEQVTNFEKMYNEVTISMISEELSVHISTLYGKKWLLPDFGNDERHMSPKSWTRTKWNEWKEIPVEERKAMYLKSLENSAIAE
jgi:hypothetical protein